MVDRKRAKKNNKADKMIVTGYENPGIAARTRRDRANHSVMPEIGEHNAHVAALKPLAQFASAAPTPKKSDAIAVANLQEMYKTGGPIGQAGHLDAETPNMQNYMMSERATNHMSGQHSIVAKGTSLSIENPGTIDAETTNRTHHLDKP